MISTVTWAAFFALVKRRLENDYGSAEFTVTDNEIALYTYPAISKVLVALTNQAYAVEGFAAVPDAFKTTYKITTANITRNWDNETYEVTLPQPPISLPMGTSIENPHFAGNGNASYPLIAVQGFNSGYYDKMEKPSGMFYKVQGSKMIIDASGFDLLNSGLKLYLTMATGRGATNSDTDTLNLPDDAFSSVFDLVVAGLSARIGSPKDKIIDGSDKKTEAA